MRIISILSFASLVITSALAQGTLLIGPSTRNGSFEDGIASPWGGVDAVNKNAGFASHGEWFAVVSGNSRTDSYLSVEANPTNDRTFLLTFDARSGIPDFNSVSASINSRNVDGSLVQPASTSLMSPTLVSTAWVTYQQQFLFPESWDGSSVRLDIAFNKFPAVAGTTYFGYLDNITLQQIPEPSSLVVLSFSSLFLIANRLRRASASAIH